MTDNKKHTLRKLLFKLLMAILLLVFLDIVYYLTLYQKDLKENCSLMELSMRAKKGVDIVYLGESSNHTYSKSDTDRRFICEMVEDLLPEHHVGNLAKDACHAGIYYDILRNIPFKTDVKTAIVTVNMRAFSAEWIYSKLETALRKEQVMMRKGPALYRRMLLNFKTYDIWTEEERSALIGQYLENLTLTLPHPFPYRNVVEWDRGIGMSYTLYNGKQPSLDTIELACHYIKEFAGEIDTNHPRIKDLDKIVELCRQRGWQPVFNILAENVDQIDSLCGPDLIYFLKRNAQFVVDRYTSKGVLVVNNLETVRDKHFIDRNFPTEHYDQTGRLTIARHLAEAIKRR